MLDVEVIKVGVLHIEGTFEVDNRLTAAGYPLDFTIEAENIVIEGRPTSIYSTSTFIDLVLLF